jgi:hypothetical protein
VAFPSKNTNVSLSLEKKEARHNLTHRGSFFSFQGATNSKKKKIQKSPFGSSSLSFLKTSFLKPRFRKTMLLPPLSART